MEYKDIPNDKLYGELTTEEKKLLFREAAKDVDPEVFKNIVLSFKAINKDIVNFIEFINNPKITARVKFIKDIAITLLSQIEEIINDNPQLGEVSLDEVLESKEFKKILEKAAKKHNLTKTQAEAVNEVLKSKLPEKYYITNNKISNEITKDFLNNGEFSLAVINPNKKGEIYTYNSLSYEGSDISITGRQQFTAYDRTVHNAVCTLFAAGNDIVTPAMVYRTFNGMTDSEYIKPQAIGAVTKSLDKSRFTRLKVDFTAEAKVRNIHIDKAIIDSNLLHAKVVTVSVSGREVSAYKILETPVLYEYAQLTKQIISIPLPLLDTRKATRNTEEIISIKEYLIRRIEIMKHGNDISNRIVYDTIFYEAGIIIKHNTERDRYRKYIKSILLLWKEKHKYIKNFKEYKEEKSFKGIEISY